MNIIDFTIISLVIRNIFWSLISGNEFWSFILGNVSWSLIDRNISWSLITGTVFWSFIKGNISWNQRTFCWVLLFRVSDYCLHLYCYTHNISADISTSLLQVFEELRSLHGTLNHVLYLIHGGHLFWFC